MTGCSAVCAANGAEALKLLAQTNCCLIILDLKMPVMSGHEFFEALPQQPSLAAIPVSDLDVRASPGAGRLLGHSEANRHRAGVRRGPSLLQLRGGIAGGARGVSWRRPAPT